MGTCFTTPEKYINECIDAAFEVERLKMARSITFIVLGSAGSGKSTLIQQIKRLNASSIQKEINQTHETKQLNDKYLPLIRNECISTIIYLLSKVGDTQTIQLLRKLSIHNYHDLKQISDIISKIWIKYDKFSRILSYSYRYSDEFKINDNISYFLDNIERLMNNDIDEKQEVILTDDDMIRFPKIDPNLISFHTKTKIYYSTYSMQLNYQKGILLLSTT